MVKMKTIYIIILLLSCSLVSYATIQGGDILIWKGDTLTLYSNPLNLRFDYNVLITKIHDEIESQEKYLFPEKYESDEIEEIYSSMCWRGYIAEWSIVNDSLFLNNIYHCHNSNVKINLDKIFADKNGEMLFASWVNGDLHIPKGELIYHVNFGYETIFEQEISLKLENGIVDSISVAHNKIIKKSAFYEKVDPNEYLEFIYSNINWKNLPDLRNKYYNVHIAIQPNEQGLIDSIVGEYSYLTDYSDEKNSMFVSDMNNIFIKEGIKIAKLIPEWDVILKRGKILEMAIVIIFSEDNKKRYDCKETVNGLK